MKRILLLLTLAVLSHTAFSQHFSSVDQTQRYQHLLQELRCVVCQNEDLAESTVPLAQQLRQQIANQIQQQQSDQAIKSYLSQRYGEFILFKPSFTPKNYLLWFSPVLLLLAAILGLLYRLSHRPVQQASLSTEEHQQLKRLLP